MGGRKRERKNQVRTGFLPGMNPGEEFAYTDRNSLLCVRVCARFSAAKSEWQGIHIVEIPPEIMSLIGCVCMCVCVDACVGFTQFPVCSR